MRATAGGYPRRAIVVGRLLAICSAATALLAQGASTDSCAHPGRRFVETAVTVGSDTDGLTGALTRPCGTLLGFKIGPRAVLHGCTVEHGCLIGMGALVLDGAVIGAESLVGAGALVTPGTVVPPRSLLLGSPAKRTREINDAELERLRTSAANYVELARRYREAP
jgi:acetyltransferase-like isoleucine patch superfamily enzyme